MRTLLLAAVLATGAALSTGCAAMSAVPADAPASADGLAAYLEARGAPVVVDPTALPPRPLEGATYAGLRVGGGAAGARPATGVTFGPDTRVRDYDARSYWALGLRNLREVQPRPAPSSFTLDVYAFDGAPDLDRLSQTYRRLPLPYVAYVSDGLVVVAPGRALSRALARAFGEPQRL